MNSDDSDLKQPAKKRLKNSLSEEIQGHDERNVNRADAVSPDLIVIQKGRAIARWEEAFAKKYFDSQTIYDDVLKKLNEGKVPPIYHTLCREPSKRLFLPNTFVSSGNTESGSIEISANLVEAGIASPQLEESTNEAIWKKDNFSYLDTFFASDALLNVNDSLIKENWEFDKEVANTVAKLVNAPADMLGHDVEVTELSSEFPVDFSNGKNLITRSLSRGVVADCFERSKKRSTHAIVGSPGIGKSWSLVYALQQALLFENSCVMFCFQKDEMAWVCIRKEHQIYAWSVESDYFETKCKSGLFHNSNVLVLLDPRESVDGGALYSQGNRRLIFAASNYSKHFSTLLPKRTAFAKRILDPFTENELEVATPYVIDDRSCFCTKTILERAKVVGCLLRYVANEDNFKERKKEQDEFIANVRNQRLDLDAIFNWNGIIMEKGTVPDTIFIVSVKKRKCDRISYNDSLEKDVGVIGDIDDDDSCVKDNDELCGEDDTESFFEDDKEKDNNVPCDDVGYDGEHIEDYGEMVVSIISSEIHLKLTKNSRKHLLSYLGKVSSGELSKMGHVVEEIFWKDLQQKDVIMKCWKAGDNIKDFHEIMFKPTSILTEIKFQDLPKKVFGREKQVVCRMSDGFQLIDFAASPLSVIQVTVSPPENHKMKLSGVKSLLLATGFLECDSNENITLTKKPPEQKIKFYWAVPFSIRKQWINRNMKQDRGKKITCNKGSNDLKYYDVVIECYRKYVDSYVILIENEPMIKTETKE